MSIFSFIRDANIVRRNAKYIPMLFQGNADDVPIYPEALAVESLPTWLRLATLWMFGGRPDMDKRTEIVHYPHQLKNPKVQTIYVNGIMADIPIAMQQAKALYHIFMHPVMLIHNPSYGIVGDLLESIFGRTLDGKTEPAKALALQLHNAIVSKVSVRLVGYSQGAIICCNALRILRDEYHIHDFSSVELFLFAPANDELDRFPGLFCESFANEFDVVARIGAIELDNYIEGETYVREGATGHMLNTHYLGAFLKGAYCGGKSRLFQYILNSTPPKE